MPSYTDKASRNINPMARLKVIDSDRTITNASTPNNLSRYHGGHRRDNHPFISGYWYFLIQPPERFFKDGTTRDILNQSVTWLHSTAESFTPPGKTLNFVDIPGMGGIASSFVSGQTLTNTFTVTFREYQELPIFSVIQNWTSVIDPNTGVSPLSGDEFVPSSYKGAAFAALCKPTINSRTSEKEYDSTTTNLNSSDIEQIFYFDGVWPENTPLDFLDSDISTNDTKTVSVNFSFDGAPLMKDSEKVISTFLDLMKNRYIHETYKGIVNNVPSATSLSITQYRHTPHIKSKIVG